MKQCWRKFAGITVAGQIFCSAFAFYRKEKKMNSKYRCPACGAESFEVTAHVTQDWKIDCNGTFLESLNECVEVTHYPDENDIWDCADCGFSAVGREFRNQPEGQKGATT